MDIKKTRSEGLLQEFSICVPASFINKKLEEKLKELSHKVKISGFRPGKIPLPVLQQRYGSNVKQEVLEAVIQENLTQLIERNKLRTATQPKIDVKPHKNGEDLNFNVTLETLPVIQEIDFSLFKFNQMVAKVEQAEIDQALEKLQDIHAEFNPVDINVKVKSGHQVHLSFYGTIADKPIEGGASEGMDLEIGSNSFIPGFEDQIIGMKHGEKKEFDIPFPKDYHASDLKGKIAHFSIEIKEIKEKIKSKLDNDFATKFNMKSVAELNEAIKDQLEQEHKSMSLITAKRDILDQFSEVFKFEIPQTLKEIEFQAIWNQLEKENKQENKKPLPPKEYEDLKEEYKALADRRVRLGLVLAEIGRKYKVDVSQKEFEQALIKEAMKYPGMERKVIDYYKSDTQAQATLRAPLFEDKVIELILEKTQVIKKEVSVSELTKHVEELTQGDED